MPPRKKAAAKTRRAAPRESARRCGICGATRNLTRTECCGNWVCDDEHKYVLFSYARNSCYRNHRRLTLCGYHFAEEHPGRWQDCPKCRKDIVTEMYAWYGTNEYKFEKLEDPPEYEPTKCHRCGRVIVLSEGGYSSKGDEYSCGRCTTKETGGKFPM